MSYPHGCTQNDHDEAFGNDGPECGDCGALAGEKCREGCQCGEAVGCETAEQLREMKADEEMGERYEDWKQGEIDAIRQDGLA